MRRTLRATLAVVLLHPPAVSATVLTLDDALERARRAAPALLAARLRADEARGRLAGAAVLLRDNPVLEAGAGRRDGDRGVSADVDASLGQTFELGGRRRARIAGAEAELARETANAEDTARLLLAEVAAAFLRAVAAGKRLGVLRASEEVAADLLRVAERRHGAGDIADLDLNVARVAAARARAEVHAAEAARQRALAALRVLVGMEAGEPLEVAGDLRTRPPEPLERLLASAGDRADLRALANEVRAAEAEARLGEGFTWPDLGVRIGYEREEGADIPHAGVSVSLPVFARGQELRATGAARARRLRLVLEARRRAIEVEVRAAFDAYVRLAEGADLLERRALPLLDDNDALARRGYEAGELSLTDYLVIRRETIGARLEHVERALEAALAGVELAGQAGALR
jgi:cobalt-zinc-cadmium efflux system outer membrane protein